MDESKADTPKKPPAAAADNSQADATDAPEATFADTPRADAPRSDDGESPDVVAVSRGGRWWAAILAHFERLGGMLVSPRMTLRRLIDGDGGHLGEIFFWVLVVVAASSPVRTGRSLLVARVALLDGISSFFVHHSARLWPLLIAVVVAGALLAIVGGSKLGWSRATDVAAFLLVPVLFLTALGVILRAAGIELWFLPHRTLRGTLSHRVVYGVVSYGWSIVLLWLALLEVWRNRSEP